MDIEEDLYELLGVGRDATPAEIKAAYRSLVKTHHPDIGGDPEFFVKLNAAYNVLTNEEERKYYDSTGEVYGVNPSLFQEMVLQTMLVVFDQIIDMAIRTGTNIDDIDDFILRYKEIGIVTCDRYKKEKEKADKLLASLRKLEKRISRKGEEKNIFADHINDRIKKLLPDISTNKTAIRVWERIFEELEHYEDGYTFIRTMQAARYPAQRTNQSGVWFTNTLWS